MGIKSGLHPSLLSIYIKLLSHDATELTTMPFEVTETGWGEFEASLKIIFRDPEEDPITLFHQIKLYPPGPPQMLTTKKVTSPCN